MENNLALENPSLSRRQFLNFLTGAAVAATAGGAAYPIASFLTPPVEVGEGGAIVAKDAVGNVIPAQQILGAPPGSRALVAGIAGEPTYLTLNNEGKLESFGLMDNCTHLGCTFPWNPLDHQFQCPCHGSRYDSQGQVVRGPADRPLQMVRVTVTDNLIWLSPWTDLDPRTGAPPWWV